MKKGQHSNDDSPKKADSKKNQHADADNKRGARTASKGAVNKKGGIQPNQGSQEFTTNPISSPNNAATSGQPEPNNNSAQRNERELQIKSKTKKSNKVKNKKSTTMNYESDLVRTLGTEGQSVNEGGILQQNTMEEEKISLKL